MPFFGGGNRGINPRAGGGFPPPQMGLGGTPPPPSIPPNGGGFLSRLVNPIQRGLGSSRPPMPPDMGLKAFTNPPVQRGLGSATPSLPMGGGGAPTSFKPSAFNMGRRMGMGRGIY